MTGENSQPEGQVAQFRYRHSGMLVASTLELPEWTAFASSETGVADVRIELSDAAMAVASADGLAVDGDRLRFGVPGVGGWDIAGGRSIVVHPDPAAHPDQIRLFTLGSAWGALGYQRGHAMWHGSAVARGGCAVLFCGDSGAGKSTMAAALVAAGGTLVADDLSRIEVAADGISIHPSSTRLKLWGAAVDHFGWRDRVLRRDWLQEDKFHCAVPENAAGDTALPLAGVVVLADGDAVTLERLRGGDAMTAMFGATLYRGAMLEALGKWGEQAALAARVAAHCPVWRLTRPKDFAALDAVMAHIAAVWPQED